MYEKTIPGAYFYNFMVYTIILTQNYPKKEVVLFVFKRLNSKEIEI
ncbi:5953_t:CDS:2 [Funneliformis caledonium]|uniref:5953_t:CDS:1 n=1 Tax=Funneliformis caledonium TaxID=1117310 RepID=A0A9N8ZPT7_9GLOM|nr:5953_t:CDS:2 [Funneliformis caledonium]